MNFEEENSLEIESVENKEEIQNGNEVVVIPMDDEIVIIPMDDELASKKDYIKLFVMISIFVIISGIILVRFIHNFIDSMPTVTYCSQAFNCGTPDESGMADCYVCKKADGDDDVAGPASLNCSDPDPIRCSVNTN